MTKAKCDVPIVGIIGRLNSGKGLVASVFEQRGYYHYSFADPMKEIVHDLFDIPRDILWGPSEKRTGEVRKMLQVLGTDYARQFRPNVWVDKMEARLQWDTDCNIPGVVISDVRFVNEAQMLRRKGATLIQVKRPLNGNHETKEVNTHLSETENALIPPGWIDYTIYNEGTREDLIAKVDNIYVEQPI